MRNCKYVFLSVLVLLWGCALETARIKTDANIKKVAIVPFFKDQVFGSRNGLVFQETFPLANVDWKSNEFIAPRLRDSLGQSGIEVVLLQYDQDVLAKIDLKSTDVTVAQQVSREIAKGQERRDVDALIVLYPLPINMYAKLSDPMGYFIVWGPVGLLSEMSMSYHPAYLVKINRGIEATLSGKSSCIIGFAVSVVDATSNQIKGEKLKVLGREELPHELWAESFDGLSSEEKEVIRASCLGALTKGINSALVDIGLVTH